MSGSKFFARCGLSLCRLGFLKFRKVTRCAWSSWQNPLRTASILLVARHPEVYEPCDDSFALVDAMLAEKANLLEQRPCLCVEVGCGSGYVITSLALILGDAVNAQFIATDISRVILRIPTTLLECCSYKHT